MNFLPSGVTENLFPNLNTSIVKATGAEALQVLPTSVTNPRDERFNSEELFASPDSMYQYFNSNYGNGSIDLLQLFCTYDLCFTPIQVKLRAQYGASLEVHRTKSDGSTEKVNNHKFIEVMNSPNGHMHDQDYFEAWTCHHNLTGKFISVLLRELSARIGWESFALPKEQQGRVIGMMPIRHDQIIKKFDIATGKFLGYEFQANHRSPKYFIHPDSLMIDVYYNPSTASQGISPTAVALKYILMDANLTTTNDEFIKNGGMPYLALILDSKMPDGVTPKNVETMKKELAFNKQYYDEQMKMGGSRFKKPLWLAGVNPESIPQTYDAAMLDSIYNRCESRVAGAYGVPAHKLQVGLENGDSRANSEVQDKEFAEQVVWTQLERMRVKIERSPIFLDWAVQGEFLVWNLEPCKIFHYQTLEKRELLQSVFKNGTLSAEVFNSGMNLPPPPDHVKNLTYFELTGLRNTQSNNQNQVGNGNEPKQLNEGK